MASLRDLAKAATTISVEQKAVGATAATDPGLFEAHPTRAARIGNRTAQTHSQAYGGEDAIGTVMDCVELYAQTASNAAYHFERNGRAVRSPSAGVQPDARGAAPGDLVRLFDTPNRVMDYTELMELSVIDLLLTGEFFWLKHEMDAIGRPQELYRLSPALIEVVPGKTAPKGYIYHVPGGEPIEYGPNAFVHVKRPNPHNPWRGLGVIAGDPRMYDIVLAATESMAQYYEHGTRLSGVLESDRSVPPSVFEKIKAQFGALYAGRQNHHKVATLERGLKFRPISGDARSSDWKGSTELTREEIAQHFKVGLPLLGHVGNADRQAVREAQRIFDNKVMRPFLNRIQRSVTRQLLTPWELAWEIDHEYVMPIEDKLDLAQALASVPGIRVREVRALVDYEPLAAEDPDLAWIDDAILNLPGGDTAEPGGHPDKNLSSEAGRPPKTANTVLFPKKPGDLPGSSDVIAPGTPQAAQKAIEEALDGTRPQQQGS